MINQDEPTRDSSSAPTPATPIWALPPTADRPGTGENRGTAGQPDMGQAAAGPAAAGPAAAGPAPGGWTRGRTAAAGAVAAAIVATAGITAAVVSSGDASAAQQPTGSAQQSTGSAQQGVPAPDGADQNGTGQNGAAPNGVAPNGVAPNGAVPNGTGRRGAFPGGMRGGGLAGALHATYVVADASGGYVTRESQNGTVSAVSASSITVASADGYNRTYTVDASTSVDEGTAAIGDVVKGHTVLIVATLSGDTATATQVTDTDLLGAPGGTQPGGTQPGGTQPGGTQPGGTQPGGTQPEGTQPGAGQPGDDGAPGGTGQNDATTA